MVIFIYKDENWKKSRLAGLNPEPSETTLLTTAPLSHVFYGYVNKI